MEESIGKDVRVFYTRKDAARYISHLDINRCMQRALARSHLPVWYTQGFNPHIYITFAMPTPLGYESGCETMDMRMVEDITYDEIKERLNAVLPEGLRVNRVDAPVHKPDDIAKAEYSVLVTSRQKTAGEMEQLFREMLTQESVPVQKKTKKGMKEIDLKPMIELLSARQTEDGLLLELRLAAGTTTNINPTLVFGAFTRFCNVEPDSLLVNKLQVYTDNPVREEIFL